ncbi:ASCH domain-containing protein [Paraburkholderia phytofirmans]|uniref:ASCH domain-containing protein n=1 Tax=Paraburkholderia phytofirmans TaxID=261302 RepID=UPI0038BDF1DF
MKALSVRNPWAWLIVRPDIVGEQARQQAYLNGLIKDVENRSRRTNFRGEFLVHASKGMTRQEYDDALRFALVAGVPYNALPHADKLERGGIVGIATIEDCIASMWRTSPWHVEGQYGFQLANAKPLPFTPCKGALGFFTVPDGVMHALRDHLATN